MVFSTFNGFLICWLMSEKRCDTKYLWMWGHTVVLISRLDLQHLPCFIFNWADPPLPLSVDVIYGCYLLQRLFRLEQRFLKALKLGIILRYEARPWKPSAEPLQRLVGLREPTFCRREFAVQSAVKERYLGCVIPFLDVRQIHATCRKRPVDLIKVL